MRVSSLALPIVAAASVSAAHSRDLRRAAHHNVVARNATERSVEERDVSKRSYSNARLTYYDITVGETSCEGFYSASDYVVALDSDLYGTYWKSDYCGSTITISYGGKSTQAKIVDECPGCPTGGLDLTQGLFEYFADTSVGVIYAEWSFDDGSSSGSGDSATTTTKAAETTSSTKKKTSTSTTPAYTPPAETTTSTKKTSTTHTTSTTPTSTHHSTTSTTPTPTSTSHSSTSTSSTVKTTSTSATPTTTSSAAPTSSSAAVAALVGAGSALAAAPTDTIEVTSSAPQILNQVNYAVYGLANIVMSA